MPADDRRARPLRGACVGLLSATLAVGAHAAGSGALPGASASVLVTAVSGVLGALAGSAPGLRVGLAALLGVLGGGQLLGHLVLGVAAGHEHAAAEAPAATGVPMVTAHVLAVGLCALLTLGAERAAAVCTAALARVLPVAALLAGPAPVPPRPVLRPARASAPHPPLLLLADAVARRGPPLRVLLPS